MHAGTNHKLVGVNIGWLIRFLLSAIFVLSTIGKLVEPSASALDLSQLFGLPNAVAEIAFIFWSMVEATLVLIIWRQNVHRIILVVPVALLGVTFLSAWRGIDCGCFGSLPFLSQFPLGSHLLLLVGMFLGLYYLTASSNGERETTLHPRSSHTGKKSSSLQWVSLAAVIFILAAFLTLPFSFSLNRAAASADHQIVDRAAVKAAIANHTAVVLDARPEFQYEMGHLPGAVNIPCDNENLSELIARHSLRSQAVIVYCSSSHCNAAELLAEKLRALGCNKVRIYSGGWEDWVLNQPVRSPH